MKQQFLYLSSAEAQLSLGLGEEKTTERLFFAVMADASTAQRAAAIADGLLHGGQVDGRPLARERLHVTLHHLGDYAGGLPPSLVSRASQAAGRVAMDAFAVEFDRVGTFGDDVRSCRACCVAKTRCAGCTNCRARWAGNWRMRALPAMRSTRRI